MKEKMSFRAVFIRNEFRALKGRYNCTIVFLFVILFITFLAFGFTKSMLNYQQKLYSDPFSNWINLNFHSGTRDSLRALYTKMANRQFRNMFHIREAYFYNKGMVSVRTFSNGGGTVQYEARTIEPGSGVVKDLLKTNVVARFFQGPVENAFVFEPNGVIISEKLARDIGPDLQTISYVRIKTPMDDFIPVPVLAVVKELPDLADIVYTNLFYCKTMNSGLYDRENAYYRVFVEDMDTSGILRVLGEICSVLEIRDPSTIQTTLLTTGNTSVLNWKIEIGAQQKEIPARVKNERLDGLASLKNHRHGQYFELSKDSICDNSAFFHDYLAIEFHDLEKIRAFSGYLSNNLALQLNLEVLAERENYLYAGNIAVGAIILLIAISIASVSLYLSGIIRNHLQRMKKNLGNFLAFGVGNKTLVLLYIHVTVKILVSALVPALILAFACGEIFEKYLLGNLMVVDRKEDYFSLFNSWFAIFLFIIVTVAVSRTFISITKILRHTPGDLVYERDY